MDTHKLVGEFLLERLQGIVDKILATGVVYANVFLVGIEKTDLIDRY